jgi:hypothetical protein
MEENASITVNYAQPVSQAGESIESYAGMCVTTT